MTKKFLLHKDKEEKSGIADANLAHLQVAPADTRPKLAKELNFACPPASLIVLCILTMTFFVERLTAQTTTPQFESFKQVNLGNQYYTNSTLTQQNQQTPTQNYSMGATANDIMEQTYRMTEERMGGYIDRPYLTPQQNQQARQNFIINKTIQANNNNSKSNQQNQVLLSILNEANTNETGKRMNFEYYKTSEFASKTKSFTDALSTLKNMASGKTPISLKDAFYIMESAYGNTYLTYKEYSNIINENTDFLKQMMLQNGLDPRNNEAIHKAIQKFMKDTTSIKSQKSDLALVSSGKKHLPFSYDYIDYKGEKDFRNYFVTKAIATGTGQCNSLPIVYAIQAEALGAQFYISTAPNHSFIKYPDNSGKVHSYEPTSHWNISDNWYSEHLYITQQAEQSGIYLDTLNKLMIIGDCIANLGIGYLNKYGVADGTFLNECINASLSCFPEKNGLQAILLRSSVLAHMLDRLLYTNGIKDLKDMDKVKGATELYNALQQNELYLKSLGYTEIPAGLYEEQMNLQEFKGKQQIEKELNGKEKRTLFINTLN